MSRLDISENLKTVRRNIASACERAGRDPGEVLLIGATKMNDASRTGGHRRGAYRLRGKPRAGDA